MSNPTDPPRPSLESGPYGAFSGYTWHSTNGVVDGNGTKVFAWLNQTGSPGKTATVYWEVGTAAEAGALAMLANITEEACTIIKSGTHDQDSGLVAYGGYEYCFRYEVGSGTLWMKPHKV